MLLMLMWCFLFQQRTPELDPVPLTISASRERLPSQLRRSNHGAVGGAQLIPKIGLQCMMYSCYGFLVGPLFEGPGEDP